MLWMFGIFIKSGIAYRVWKISASNSGTNAISVVNAPLKDTKIILDSGINNDCKDDDKYIYRNTIYTGYCTLYVSSEESV